MQQRLAAKLAAGKVPSRIDHPHLLGDPGTAASYAPTYSALVGLVAGDWLSAIERYRRWGSAQYWARESRLRTGATPDWLLNTANNRFEVGEQTVRLHVKVLTAPTVPIAQMVQSMQSPSPSCAGATSSITPTATSASPAW